jgi:hypothetical protein
MTRSVAWANVVVVSVAMGLLTGCGAGSRLPVGVGAPVVRSQAILDPGYNPAPNYPHNPGYNPSPFYPGCRPAAKPNPANPRPNPRPNPRIGTEAILPPYVNPGSGCR